MVNKRSISSTIPVLPEFLPVFLLLSFPRELDVQHFEVIKNRLLFIWNQAFWNALQYNGQRDAVPLFLFTPKYAHGSLCKVTTGWLTDSTKLAPFRSVPFCSSVTLFVNTIEHWYNEMNEFVNFGWWNQQCWEYYIFGNCISSNCISSTGIVILLSLVFNYLIDLHCTYTCSKTSTNWFLTHF